MIINFKIFEKYTSKQEEILNIILDKIQQSGKESLSVDELNYLKDYPDGDITLYEKPEEKKSDEKYNINFDDYNHKLKEFTDNIFHFSLFGLKFNKSADNILIIGKLRFQDNKIIDGYFEVNMDTHQIQPSFYDEFKNTYDLAAGNEYELDNFLENVFLEIMDDMQK